MSSTDALLIGGAILGYALLSRRLSRTPLTAAIIFVVVGLVVGSEGFDVLDLDIGSSGLRLLAEATLALLLFSDAASIDTRRLVRQTGLPVRLLVVALPLTILIGSAVAVALFPDLFVFEAVALAVLLAPTDAALGQAVIADPRLPSTVSQGLSVESGLNDGICVPLLFAAIAFAEVEEAHGIAREVLTDLVTELATATAVGIGVGACVGAARVLAERRRWSSDGWRPIVPLVATAITYVVTVDAGGSGFIGAFVAGLAYGRIVGADTRSDKELTAQLGELLSGVTLVLFGAVLVGRGLDSLDVQTVLYAVLSLTVIRMVPVALALLGTGARRPTILLVGWFGPRGLATIVFTLIIVEESGLAGTDTVTGVATVTVLFSVFAHGLTAPWLVRRYVGWFHGERPSPAFESGGQPSR